jgi:O-antigen ligase
LSARVGRTDAVVVVVVSGTVVGLGLWDGGFFVEARAWAALALSWLLAMAVFVRDRLEFGRLELAFLGALVALAGWVALSSGWSGDAGLSLEDASRVFLYAVAVAAVVLIAESGAVVAVLGGVLLGIVGVVADGLCQYLLFYGERLPDRFEGYLLFEPLGYANSFGALCAIGIILAAGLAMHADDRRRVGALLGSLVPLGAALYLTSSRGAWLALALGIALLLAFERRRPWRVIGLGAISALLAVLVSRHADLQAQVPRFDSDGARILGLELLGLTCAVAGTAYLMALRPARTKAGGQRAPVGPAVVAMGAVVALGLAVSGVVDLSLGDRKDYWRVAWDEWQDNRVLGGGAGSFGDYWQHSSGTGVHDAHSLYLETLAELGVIGLALLMTPLLIPIVAAVRARAHPLVPTALAAYSALLAHAGIDWDWEMPAVTLSGVYCGTAVLLATRPHGEHIARLRTRPWPLAVAAMLVALAFAQLIWSGTLEV